MKHKFTKKIPDMFNLSSKSVGYLECWSQFLLAFKNKLHNKKNYFGVFHYICIFFIIVWWGVVYFNYFFKYILGKKNKQKNPIKIVNSRRRNLRPTKGFLS